MSEEEMVVAAQRGNKDAFYKLICSYSDNLYNIAYCYLKDQHEALEAVQETTCRAFVKINKLKNPQYFKTWLTRILINYCVDELKRKKKSTLFYGEELSTDNTNKAENLDLESAVNELEPRYKHVIVLKYFQDMTSADIAQVLNCPEGTVKTWIHRALKILKQSLNKEGGYDV